MGKKKLISPGGSGFEPRPTQAERRKNHEELRGTERKLFYSRLEEKTEKKEERGGV